MEEEKKLNRHDFCMPEELDENLDIDMEQKVNDYLDSMDLESKTRFKKNKQVTLWDSLINTSLLELFEKFPKYSKARILVHFAEYLKINIGFVYQKLSKRISQMVLDDLGKTQNIKYWERQKEFDINGNDIDNQPKIKHIQRGFFDR